MDFDGRIDRSGTWSLKWDNPKNAPGKPGILPFWVADMDFPPPPSVLEAIRARAEHPIFGYTRADPVYAEAVAAWYASRQGLVLRPEELVLASATMPAVAAAIRAYSERGEAVIIMPPVYHPFSSIVLDNDRAVFEAPLANRGGGRWEIDLDSLEAAARKAEAAGSTPRILLISSPHNPVGRVWAGSELASLLGFARSRKLVLVSDELHGDLVYAKGGFSSFTAVEGAEARGILVISGPNKTFNLAGLHLCQMIARNEADRRVMKRAMDAVGFSQPNTFSFAAGIAAYRSGGPWLDALLGYLAGNRAVLASFVAATLPGAVLSPTEGSYLAWIDVRGQIARLGLRDDVELASRLEEEARIKLSPGSGFGRGGEGHLRFNLACPRPMLEEGLARFAAWLEREGSGRSGA